MKALLTAVLFIATSALFAQTKQTDVSKVEWLTGQWTRTNAKPGRSGSEMWNKKSTTELIGRGINMKGADTTFVEKIRIVAKDGDLFYIADVPENKSEVWFKFTELKDKSFVCENPQHDFPKKIAYTLEGNSLKATISGNGKSIDYLFLKN